MKSFNILFLSLLLCGLATSAFAADFALVVNKSNPLSSLSANDAKQMYLGKKTSWSNGQTIVLYSQYDEKVTQAFVDVVVKKTVQQFQIYWKKALFTGTGTPPIELKNDVEVKKFIAADPRGIGYISRAALDDSVKEIKLN